MNDIAAPTTADSPIAIPAQPPTELAARVVDVVKRYGSGDTEVRALDGITVGFTSTPSEGVSPRSSRRSRA